MRTKEKSIVPTFETVWTTLQETDRIVPKQAESFKNRAEELGILLLTQSGGEVV